MNFNFTSEKCSQENGYLLNTSKPTNSFERGLGYVGVPLTLLKRSIGHTKKIYTPFLYIPERTVFSNEAYGVISQVRVDGIHLR
jgi:hypothetical protein